MKRVMFWGLAAVLAFLNVRSSAQDNKDSAGWTLRKPIIDQSDSAHDDDGGIDRSLEHTNGRGPYSPLDGQELPIKSTRTIAFTTDEGSNMDVDVSPDGSTLLFDILGDLYSVPVTGGNATQITRGMAINRQPVWSPNGKKFAYISDFSGSVHLNVRDISGKFHLVLGASDEQVLDYNHFWPVWTPDGNYVTIGGTFHNFIYGLAGGKVSSLSGVYNPIGFSADGKFVYYFDSARLFSYNYFNNVRKMISPILKGFESGILSPDLHWLVYIADSNSKKSLIVHDLVENTERVLVPSLVLRWCLYDFPLNTHYAFSPDSKYVFIGYGGKIHQINITNGNDNVVHFTAHVRCDLGRLDYNTFRVAYDSLKVKYTRSANASIDGRHLVFSALDKIYIKDLPNGKPSLLARQSINQFQPVYSPDGKWIAYVSWCDTAGGDLWKVLAAGGKPVQLTHVRGQYRRPAWSPDGELIAVVKGIPQLPSEETNGQLEIIPVAGGTVRVIDNKVPLRNGLTFSPDGRRIIYQPDRMAKIGDFEPLLVSRDLQGKSFRIELVGKSEDVDMIWIRQRSISPNGRFVVYSQGEDLYLIPVCNMTAPIVIDDSNENVSAIRFGQGMDPFWEDGGKTLSWSYGNRFYRADPDKILTEAQWRKASGSNDSSFVSVTIKPRQVISMDVTAPCSFARGNLAIKNVRILTMHGNKVISRGTILIENGRFAAVGPTGMINMPKGTRILNLQGTTVMPGLVDVHLHMPKPPEIFPQQSWAYLINLAYGVTTARDPRTNVDDFGYKELLETGQMLGPRLYPSGQSVNPGGLDDIRRVGSIYDARSIVLKRATLGGTFIKQYLLPTRLQREWLLIASREAGMNMTNEGDFTVLTDLGMMKDGSTGVEHNPIWGDVYKDVTMFVAQTGTFFTPTLQIHKGGGKDLLQYLNYLYWRGPNAKIDRFMPDATAEDKFKRREILSPQPADTTDPCFVYPAIVDAEIRKQGGYVTLGSHGNNEGIGVHNELWALQLGGLNNMEALQAATIMGAEAIGIQNDVGSIEVGKIADLIVLNKNPLEDIHNSREIRYVMKGGILYDANTLDEIWPEKKKCPEWRLKSTSGN